jgi:hypothetical protein
MKRFLQKITPPLLILFFAWWAIASLVFAFRHPWMTETERFVYAIRALTFDTVPYNEARPRE